MVWWWCSCLTSARPKGDSLKKNIMKYYEILSLFKMYSLNSTLQRRIDFM